MTNFTCKLHNTFMDDHLPCILVVRILRFIVSSWKQN